MKGTMVYKHNRLCKSGVQIMPRLNPCTLPVNKSTQFRTLSNKELNKFIMWHKNLKPLNMHILAHDSPFWITRKSIESNLLNALALPEFFLAFQFIVWFSCDKIGKAAKLQKYVRLVKYLDVQRKIRNLRRKAHLGVALYFCGNLKDSL